MAACPAPHEGHRPGNFKDPICKTLPLGRGVWTCRSCDAPLAPGSALAEFAAALANARAVRFTAAPSADDLRSTALTFPWSSAVSADGTHPRHLALASDPLLWRLSAIFVAMLRLAFCPDLLAWLILSLIGKPGGGDRNVGLFGSPIRVLLRWTRRNFGAAWLVHDTEIHPTQPLFEISLSSFESNYSFFAISFR